MWTMSRSDSSRRGARQPAWVRERSVGTTPRAWAGGRDTVESVLRLVVAGSGLALVGIAVVQIAATTSLAAVTALFASDTTQWILVAVFGCALVVAAGRTRRPERNDQ